MAASVPRKTVSDFEMEAIKVEIILHNYTLESDKKCRIAFLKSG